MSSIKISEETLNLVIAIAGEALPLIIERLRKDGVPEERYRKAIMDRRTFEDFHNVGETLPDAPDEPEGGDEGEDTGVESEPVPEMFSYYKRMLRKPSLDELSEGDTLYHNASTGEWWVEPIGFPERVPDGFVRS